HSSGTDHLEVDYRSPDHSHFTIAIPDDWTDQDLLEILDHGIGRLGKFLLMNSYRSGSSGSGKARRSQTSKLGFFLKSSSSATTVAWARWLLATRRSCCRKRIPSPTNRLRCCRTSPTRPSSPSRMRGYSTSCASHCSSKPPRPTCSR